MRIFARAKSEKSLECEFSFCSIFNAAAPVSRGCSEDKGENTNLLFFVHKEDDYRWIRTYFTRQRLQIPHIYAVHFVVYDILDSLEKDFADYTRSKCIPIPDIFVRRYDGRTYSI